MDTEGEEKKPTNRIRSKIDSFTRGWATTIDRLERHRLARWMLAPLRIVLRYFREIHWEDDQAYGFALARDIWHAGWLGKAGLLGILAALAAAAWMLGKSPPSEAGSAQTIPLGMLALGLVIYAIGWSYAQAFSVEIPFWAYTLLAAYLSWYGSFLGGSLAGSPPFILPAAWILALGWLIFRSESGRLRWLCLLLLCLGAGQLSFAALGFHRILPAETHTAGRWAFGFLLFLFLSAASFIRRIPIRRPNANFAFLGTLLVAGVFFSLAWQRNPTVVQENTLLTFQGLLGLIDLLWFWLGWTVIEGTLTLSAWGMKESKKIIPTLWFQRLTLLLWGVACFISWWATRSPPLFILVWTAQLGLDRWINSWSLPVYFTVHDLLWPTLCILVITLALRISRRLDFKLLARLNGIWIAVILGLYAYYVSLLAFATLEEDSAPVAESWAVLILVGGIVWELARSGAAYWESESRKRQFAILSGLFFMSGIAFATLAAGLPDLNKEYTLYSFLGMVTLGIPLGLYTLLPEWIDYEPPPGTGLLGWMGLGVLSSVLVLGIHPQPGLVLGLAPLLWGLALAALGRRLGRLAHLLDGPLAGACLALGFVTFWMSPEVLPVPFLQPLHDWQMRYLMDDLNRPLLRPAQAWFTLTCLLFGCLTGWLVTGRLPVWLKMVLLVLAGVLFIILTSLEIAL